jgi:hypothetical protein
MRWHSASAVLLYFLIRIQRKLVSSRASVDGGCEVVLMISWLDLSQGVGGMCCAAGGSGSANAIAGRTVRWESNRCGCDDG